MINNTKKLVFAATVTILLAACSETTRSTEWYVQHSLEQGNDLDECNRNPELNETPNCINAKKAELILEQGTDAIKEYLTSHGLVGRAQGQ